MGFENGARIVTRNLGVYLNAADSFSYGGSGATWFDISGNAKNGTLILNPTFNNSYGGSFAFNGSTQYVSLQPVIDTNVDMTMIFACNITTGGAISTLISGGSNGHLQIRVKQQNDIQLVKSNTVDMGTFSGSVISIGTPNIIAVSFVKSTSTYNLYINGNSINSITNAQTFVTSSPALGYNIQPTEYIKGNIYNFAYYNRTLSADEVLQNYNAQKSRFNLP